MTEFLKQVNENIVKKNRIRERDKFVQTVDNNEYCIFMAMLSYLHFYRCSPSDLMDAKNSAEYPAAWRLLTLERFNNIVDHIHISTEDITPVEETEEWEEPMSFSKGFERFMKIIREVCAIAFVKKYTKVAFDDHQFDLRSNLNNEVGLVRRKNPAKGYGPVLHGAGSVFARFFLGGHICKKGETPVDALKELARSWAGENDDKKIVLKGTEFYSDREYQSDAMTAFTSGIGGSTTGTSRRVSTVCCAQDYKLKIDLYFLIISKCHTRNILFRLHLVPVKRVQRGLLLSKRTELRPLNGNNEKSKYIVTKQGNQKK